MRQIGSVNEEPDALRFSDYLLTQGVKNSVEPMAGGAWAVWVEDDDLIDRAKSELDQFRSNPADPRYHASARAQKRRSSEAKAQERRQKKFVDVRTRWAAPGQVVKPVTIVLVAISIVVSIGMKLGMAGPTPTENALLVAPVGIDDDGRHYSRGNVVDGLRAGQVWRLVTPIFIHYGPLHLIFNMFWLLDLGSMVETRKSSLFLLLLVLVTAVFSNVAEYYLPDPRHANQFFGGMSGVNYALFGYAWIKGKFQPHQGIGVSEQTIALMFVWLFVCMTGLVGPVANVAHVGGLLGGAAFAYLPYALGRLRHRG